MQYIEFGKDKDKVSEIVMGLMRISEMSTGEVLDLIETGLEEGINFLDLADIYGGGKSEEVIGKVFTENPSLRTEFFIQSKCGIRCDPDFTYFDFSRDYILEAVDGILSRLIQIIWIACFFTDQMRLWNQMKLQRLLTAFIKLEKYGILGLAT